MTQFHHCCITRQVRGRNQYFEGDKMALGAEVSCNNSCVTTRLREITVTGMNPIYPHVLGVREQHYSLRLSYVDAIHELMRTDSFNFISKCSSSNVTALLVLGAVCRHYTQ